MDKRMIIAAAGLVFIAALSRLVPHPHNFAPLAAMAVFAGAYLGNRVLAFAVPLLALLASDIVINMFVLDGRFGSFMYDGFAFIYGAMILTVLLGIFALKKVTPVRLAGVTVTSTMLFFVITNFGAWTVNAWSSAPLYARSIDGLAAAYIAGVPFLRNALAGDLFYAAVLFGLYEFAARKTTIFASARN